MDEQVIKYYRRLLRTGFEHAGSLENPSIFLDSVGERIRVCGGVGNYMHIYINIREGVIDDMKYMCLCDPTANVVVEILCTLIKGKTVEAARGITEESFSKALGSTGEEFLKKARGVIELLNRGLTRYRSGVA
jgi:NifU-like protein involved in Fe-S cluster formation